MRVTEGGLDVMEKSTPVPLRDTFRGLSGELSGMTAVAARAPIAEGVNVTPTLQVLPDASTCPEQLSEAI